MSHATFGLLPWRPRSQHDLASTLCLAQNFVIWSQILQLLLTNYFSVSNIYSGSITRFWPALVLSGATFSNEDEKSCGFGLLESKTTLVISDPQIDITTQFSISRIVGGSLINHNGEVNPIGKYTAVRVSGQIQFGITSTSISDADTYTCVYGTTPDTITYALSVGGLYNYRSWK